MLLGTYNYVIDEKGRINFPAKFREEMGETFPVTLWLDNCLVAFPENEWQRVYERLQQGSMVRGRDVPRFLYASAITASPDKQGRIVLPAALRAHAHLEKDVTIIGVGNHAEIWDTEAWRKVQQGFSSEAMAAAMEQLEF